MADSLKLDVVLPVKPAALYEAWLDSETHAAFTEGGPAVIEARVGGKHMAWDRYITGEQKVLEHGKKIIQTWRTTEFPADAPDSLLTVLFEAEGSGTLLTVIHENLPQGTAAAYLKGWDDFYFQPMLKFFQPANIKAPAKKSLAKKKTVAVKKKTKAAAAKKKNKSVAKKNVAKKNGTASKKKKRR
jgi:activator of HSP90 ATPase